MVTIQSVLLEMREKFRTAGIDTPDLDARLLIQSALGLSQEELFLNNSRILTDSESKKLAEMVARRLKHEPVSRILGKRGFWRSEFKVSRETLDPRADSETLIEAVLKHAPKDKSLSILDLGTGTGCLLLSLLQEFPLALGLGIDISSDAVATARQNSADLSLSGKSKFMEIDWKKDQIPGAPFDIVISNPPYIAEDEMAGLAPEVTHYDPVRALVGGKDGLECYREIAALLPKLLTKAGLVFFEIGATQAVPVTEILADSGFSVVQVLPDLGGHNRCVIARWT
jgi:release factor glutamine methyltransferase